MKKSFRRAVVLGLVLLGAVPFLQAWRSELYPVNWRPPGEEKSFYTDAFVQDFSRVGYRAGEPIPAARGRQWNVTAAPFRADATGKTDATAAIQAAIDAAAKAGGGVVFLPAGTYRLSVPERQEAALHITSPDIVLRGAGVGKTFLLNTTTKMRGKKILLVAGPRTASFTADGEKSTAITRDLSGPATIIPVQSTAGFSVGDWVTVRTDTTDAWITEHRVPEWRGQGERLGGLAYRRQIVAISGKNITLDTATRYAVLQRDNARLVKARHSGLTGCGLEDFSIGNLQHDGKAWKHEDYRDAGKSAYDTHGSGAIQLRCLRDCWVRNVESYQPKENRTTTHILSNGILLDYCHGVTVERCHFQRPQYGGGGGNGYMYRLSNSSECLLRECRATYSRHGFVFSSMRSSGNVFYRCIDTDTGRACGDTGGYNTGGTGSDHHMHFSHSNLIDACTANSSYFIAAWRPYGDSVKHNVTAAHSLFWNTEGKGKGGAVVVSEQARYGYVIGTRGSRADVSLPTGGGKERLAPVDWVEGKGRGASLEPFSLYEDQYAKRPRLNTRLR